MRKEYDGFDYEKPALEELDLTSGVLLMQGAEPGTPAPPCPMTGGVDDI